MHTHVGTVIDTYVVIIKHGFLDSPSRHTYLSILAFCRSSTHHPVSGFGEAATPFSGLLHFTLDSHLIMLRAGQGGIRYHFFFFSL